MLLRNMVQPEEMQMLVRLYKQKVMQNLAQPREK